MVSDIEPRDPPRAKRGAPRSGKPTLRTIAEMTGFAITTISRALNNAPELAQETRERVQKIAAEIGYVPDRTALRLKTGRTHVISLILDPHDEILNFSQSLVSGLTAALPRDALSSGDHAELRRQRAARARSRTFCATRWPTG